MAKKKKGQSAMGIATPSGPSRRRVDVGIEDAENGFVVRTTSEGMGKNGYESKTHVASNHADAIKIAKTHMNSIGKKPRGKRAKRKAVASKG